MQFTTFVIESILPINFNDYILNHSVTDGY